MNHFATMTKRAPSPLPSHVAVIMDGNGRWATRRGRPRWMGHVRGAHTAFSSDNWKRPREEVGFLLDLFASHLERQLKSLLQHGIRLSIIGRRDRLPAALVAAMEEAEGRTVHGTRLHLRVAIDYSSRAAIAQAFADGSAGSTFGVAAENGSGLLPPVDLLIRTGGERRLSDFLLWECAYAELAFLDVNFPDLSTKDVDAVLADYAARDRRFGGVTVPPLESMTRATSTR
jgi:undecaprenyl diphosphate synthase